MKRRIILTLLVLGILIPMEVYAWINISPFFWQPGVAYTQLGWGYVLIGMFFMFIPIAVVGAIFEDD